MLHNDLTFEIKENNPEIKSPVIRTIVKFCCTIVSCRCTINLFRFSVIGSCCFRLRDAIQHFDESVDKS